MIIELSTVLRCCRQDDVFCEEVTFTQFIILYTIAWSQGMNMADLHRVLLAEHGGGAFVNILDEGLIKKIDLALWYNTTTLGGGFVYFTSSLGIVNK